MQNRRYCSPNRRRRRSIAQDNRLIGEHARVITCDANRLRKIVVQKTDFFKAAALQIRQGLGDDLVP